MKNSRAVLEFKPTQFAVGMLEVDEKVAELKTYSKKKLKNWVKETLVPVIISPHGEFYVVDRHHFLCVCFNLSIKKVRYEILKDLSKSKMRFSEFWRWMHKQKNVYPYCQFGEGPRNPLYLPRDIRGLADDPYRSLAWYVRKAGAFEPSEKNFAEFQWANFFRKRGLLDRHGLRGFAQALLKATKLAQSPAAKGLPGYGKLNIEQVVKVEKKAKKRVKDSPEIEKKPAPIR